MIIITELRRSVMNQGFIFHCIRADDICQPLENTVMKTAWEAVLLTLSLYYVD